MTNLYPVSKHIINVLNLFKMVPKVLKFKVLPLVFFIFYIGASYAQCPFTSYNVIGGGAYCSGGSGVTISLDNSDAGVEYWLIDGTNTDVTSLTSIGGQLDFINITVADIYTIQARDPLNVCAPLTMNGTATVVVNPLPTVNAGGAMADICQGGTSAALGGSVGGGATGGTWSSSAGGTFNPDATTLNATWTLPAAYSGTATLTLTTSGGSCGTTSDNKTMVVNPSPTVNAGGAMADICQGGTSAALGGSVGGGATGGTWSSSAGGTFNPDATTLNATWTPPAAYSGTATLTLTTSGGSCGTTSDNKTIVVNPSPTVNAGGAMADICQSGTTAALGGSFGGGATSAVWSDGGAGGSFTNNGGGTPNTTTYTAAANSTSPVTLTLTTAGGSCGTTFATKQVTVNPNPTVNVGGAVAAICQDGTTAALGGSFGGGATSAVWSDGGAGGSFTNNGGVTPNTTTYTAAANSTSPVTLTLTTSGGSCGTTFATKQVTVNPNPTVNVGGAVAAICQDGTTAVLGGSFGGGATSAVWSDGGAGGSFTNNGGVTPNTTTYTAAANSTSPVTLTLTTSGGSCGTTFATKQVTVNPNPTVNVGGAVAAICQGGTTAALGGSFGGGATSAVWSDGGAGGSFINNGGGTPNTTTYTAAANSTSPVTLTLTTSGGSCGTTFATKQVTVNPNPTVNVGGAVAAICQGGTTAALGGSFGGGATSAVWSDGGAGGSFINNGGGTPNTTTYTAAANSTSPVTLTLTTSGGSCGTTFATKQVTVNPNPTVNVGGAVAAICQGGTTVALGGSIGGGATGGTWSSSAAGAFNPNATTLNATWTPPAAYNGTATLTLTTSGGSCGTTSDNKNIVVNPPPVATAGSNIATCTGTNAITMTGATASGTYSGTPTWSGSGGTWAQNANPALAIFTPSTGSGSITATLTLTGTNGCVDATSTRTITWGTQPVAVAGSNITTCTGTNAITMTGATASGTYSGTPTWSGGGGTWAQNANPALATFTPLTRSGSITATLTLTGANGCVDATSTKTITWGTVPSAPTNPVNGERCGTGFVVISATVNSGETIDWYATTSGGSVLAGGTATTSFTTPSIATTTNFYAEARNTAAGCISASRTIVAAIVNAPFTPTITASPSPICLGQSVTFTATGFSSADTINGGDFDNANPPGWVVRDNGVVIGMPASANNGASNNPWSETNGPKTFFNGVNSITYNSQLGGKFAVATGVKNTTLETPVFSTVGKTADTLDFYQAFNLTPGTTAKIELSLDGGATYNTTLAQYNPPSTFGVPNGAFTRVQIPLNAYLGRSNLRVRYTYISTSTSSWAMDFVNLQGGYKPITYSWPSGFTVASNTGTVTPTTPGVNSYTLLTSYAGCAASTTNFSVTVNDSVKIIAQPSTSPFCVGSNSAITLSASGTSLGYKWQLSTTGIAGTYTDLTNVAPYSTVTTTTLNLTKPPIALSSNFYRALLTGTAACGSKTSNPIALKYSNVWMGTTSTDWNLGSNWSDGSIPSTGCDTVYIPFRSTQPTLNTNPDAVIKSLIIYPSAILTVASSTVTRMKIAGVIINNGRFDVTAGSIELNGTTATQSIPANVFYTNKIKDLTLSNNVTLDGVDSLTGTLSFGSTSKNFDTKGNLTLKSTAAGTAAVGPIINSNSITGAVTVERYFGVKRAWRFLSVPTNNAAQTLRQSWMENAINVGNNPVSGYGTQVTNNTATAVADGFDYFSPDGPSVKRYDPASGTYISITNPSVGIKTSEGWMTFVRGDRTAIGLYATPTATILRTKGTLYTGPQSFAVGAGQFQGINNPYAAPLDMRQITKTSKEFIYLWDPALTGSNGLGAFQTFSFNVGDGNYYPTPGGGGGYPPGGSPYNFIQSGLAFFVQGGVGSGNVSMTENSKGTIAAAGNLTLYRPVSQNAVVSEIRVNLYAIETNGEASLVDGTLHQFADSYGNAVDKFDAKKMTNVSENLAIKTDSQLLVIERRHTINEEDTIQMNMLKMKVKSYKFEFIGKDFDLSLTAFLEDSYYNIRTPLNINGTSTFDFNVENIPGSWNPTRFRIVFASAAGGLPITFSVVKASQQNKDITVEWKVENEKNMKQYEVEKSSDGQHFTLASTVTAKQNNNGSVNYQWLDINAFTGNNYYRIKSIDINGEIQYSNIVKIVIGQGRSQIMIYPNPVSDGNINLQLINQPKGRYLIRLMNKLGQVIIVKQIEREEGSSTETLKVKLLAHGNYHLEVTKPDKSKINMNVLH